MPSTASAVLILCLLFSPSVFAQDEAALKRAFEGRRVSVKIDMPATSAGIDIYPQLERPLDYKKYGDRIRAAGVSLKTGDSSTITLIKVKKDLIEFQIGGGGWDEGTGYVAPDYVGKSNREKQLEKDVKAETDPAKKRQLQRDLDDERNRRERDQRRANDAARAAQAANQERIAEQRLHAGSRFNLRYDRQVPSNIDAEDVMAALAEYVDFPGDGAAAVPAAAAPARTAAAADGMPRKGMLRAEAERQFGRAQETSDRKEGTLKVTTATFVHGEQRIVAEFVEDVLIRYTISSR